MKLKIALLFIILLPGLDYLRASLSFLDIKKGKTVTKVFTQYGEQDHCTSYYKNEAEIEDRMASRYTTWKKPFLFGNQLVRAYFNGWKNSKHYSDEVLAVERDFVWFFDFWFSRGPMYKQMFKYLNECISAKKIDFKSYYKDVKNIRSIPSELIDLPSKIKSEYKRTFCKERELPPQSFIIKQSLTDKEAEGFLALKAQELLKKNPNSCMSLVIFHKEKPFYTRSIRFNAGASLHRYTLRITTDKIKGDTAFFVPGPFDMSDPLQNKAVELFIDHADRFCPKENKTSECEDKVDDFKAFIVKELGVELENPQLASFWNHLF